MMLECTVDGHTRPTMQRTYGAEEMLVGRQQHSSERRWTAPQKKKYPKAENGVLYFFIFSFIFETQSVSVQFCWLNNNMPYVVAVVESKLFWSKFQCSVFCVFFHLKNVSLSSSINDVKQASKSEAGQNGVFTTAVLTADPHMRFVECRFNTNVLPSHSAGFIFFANQLSWKATLQKLECHQIQPDPIFHGDLLIHAELKLTNQLH